MSRRRSIRLSAAFVLAFATAAPLPSFAEEADEQDELEADDDEEEDADLAEETKREEADRTHVGGGAAGSLSAPVVLDKEELAARLCTEVQGTRGAKPGSDHAALRETQRLAMRNVYRVRVAPGGFKLGDYRTRSEKLPLRLEHPFYTLDGALRLMVVQKSGGAFDVPAKDAEELLRAHDEKDLALDVVFRVDRAMSETIAPCFSYPKSAVYALNIEPLSYALVRVSNPKKELVAKTPALARLKEWIDPGKARLSIIASAEGPLDGDALTRVIEAKRPELEACFGPMMQSASATGMVAYDANVTPKGAFDDVRVEAESLADGGAAGQCAAKLLASLSAPKAAKSSRAHVAFTIERGEDAPVLTD